MRSSSVHPLVAPPAGLPWRALLFAWMVCLSFPLFSQNASAPTPGSISGVVLDSNGGVVPSARIRLTQDKKEATETGPDADGRFAFSGVASGAFQLTVSADGFVTQSFPGELQPGESLSLPPVSLSVLGNTTEVRVSVTNYELAEEQIKIEETQRVLGVIPNYFVSYQQNTLPLRPKQKFELAWKTSVDPVTFAAAGAFAGIEQANDTYSGYGQGSKGFAKRYGASYGDAFIGIMVGGAIFPSLFKQDPRYFYKGTGSVWSRAKYAAANAVICKGDNGKWQFDYSGIMGSLAAGGFSNLYYPARNRNGFGLTMQNTAIGIGGSAIGNLFQEFLVRHLTPHTHGPQSIHP